MDEANSDSEEEEEKKRVRKAQPFIPSYLRMLADGSKEKKRGPKSITRTTRRKQYVNSIYSTEADRDYQLRLLSSKAKRFYLKLGSIYFEQWRKKQINSFPKWQVSKTPNITVL